MANPGSALRARRLGPLAASTGRPATSSAARVMQVMGREFSENAVPLETARHGVVVTGLAGLPTYSRANSLSQFYFVNGRSVRDKVLLGRGARGLCRLRVPRPLPGDRAVPRGRSGCGRCKRPSGKGRAALPRCRRGALGGDPRHLRRARRGRLSRVEHRGRRRAGGVPGARDGGGGSRGPSATRLRKGHHRSRWRGRQPTPARSAVSPSRAPASSLSTAEPARTIRSARRGRRCSRTIIVAQNGDSLVLVDQHAAHERLVYERFKAQLAERAGTEPDAAHSAGDRACRTRTAPGSRKPRRRWSGWDSILERFGARAIAVRETPGLLGQADVEGLVKDVADGLAEWDSTDVLSDRLDAIIARMACHGSVRSGRRAAGRRNERAAARDGTHAALRPVHPRPADLCRAQAQRPRADVRADGHAEDVDGRGAIFTAVVEREAGRWLDSDVAALLQHQKRIRLQPAALAH